jgi:hypothetical protein
MDAVDMGATILNGGGELGRAPTGWAILAEMIDSGVGALETFIG